MFQPKYVSIIIPVKNGQDTIQKLLESIRNVRYEPYEIVVVVDDGSFDKVKEIVSKFPIKLIRQNSNQHGANSARNIGIKAAHGQILAFIDADCIVKSNNWLQEITTNLVGDIACAGGTMEASNSEKFFGYYGDNSRLRLMPLYQRKTIMDKQNYGNSRFPVSANMAITREALEQVGDFDENYRGGYEEFDLEERLIQKGYKIVGLPNAVIAHRHRETFKGLLMQYYRYGVGSGRYCKKFPKSPMSRFHNFFMSIFIILVIIPLLSLILGLVLGPIYLVGLAFDILPIFIFIPYYTKKMIKQRKLSILLFPFIDGLRAFVFYLGQFKSRLIPQP